MKTGAESFADKSYTGTNTLAEGVVIIGLVLSLGVGSLEKDRVGLILDSLPLVEGNLVHEVPNEVIVELFSRRLLNLIMQGTFRLFNLEIIS